MVLVGWVGRDRRHDRPATCRELNRSLTTLKDSLNKRDLLRRIKDLEGKLKQLEAARAA